MNATAITTNPARWTSSPISRRPGIVLYWATIVTTLIGATAIATAELRDGVLRYEENTIDGGLTVIGFDGTLSGAVHNLAVPSSVLVSGMAKPVKAIGQYAFDNTAITGTVTIPNTVLTIGDGAFSNCSLAAVALPDSITYMGANAFFRCSNLQNISIPSGLGTLSSSSFSECTSLKSLTFGKGPIRIAHSAFHGCVALSSISFAAGAVTFDELGYSDQGAFSDCSGLTSLKLPVGQEKIGGEAFSGCTSLAIISFPEGVAEITNGAFSGCSSLTSVALPKSLKTIGSNAFAECDSLKALNIPNGVSRIYGSAFLSCNSLESVAIGNGVTQIGPWAFSGCNSLASVFMGTGISLIEKSAFYSCINLKTVEFTGSAPIVEESYYSTFDSNYIIAIKCYRNRAFEDVFDDTGIFKIQYLEVPAPDIAVFSPSGTELRTKAERYFGRIKAGKASRTVTFKIRNNGSLPLNNIKIGNSGGNRSDFRIVASPSKTLAPGGTTTFRVKFKPRLKGECDSILKIGSNDPDEKIIKIKLMGIGS